MHRLKSILFFSFVLFFCLHLNAQKNSMNNRQVTVLKDKIVIDYTFSANNDFTSMVSGFKLYFHQCGMPLLPKLNEYVVVPKKSKPLLKISSKSVTLKNTLVAQSIPTTIDSDLFIDSVCSQNYWETNQILPTVSGQSVAFMELEPMDLLFFELYPFQYNPKRRELTINTRITVEISLETAFGDKQVEVSSLDYLMFSSSLNFTSVQQNLKSISDTFPNYVIVTHPSFSLAAKTLALWKEQQGYKTFVYQNSTWEADSIRHLMISLYQNVLLRPDYLVLLGDTDFVPSIEKTAPPPIPEQFSTDLYFSTMDSDTDFVANFSVGRISVSNVIESQSVVDKLVKFQKKPPFSPSFYQKMINCSYFQDDNLDGFDDRRFVQTSEEVRNYLQTNFSKNVIRIYEAGATVYPQFWNNDDYSAGEPIGADLVKPTFAWNGSSSDIVNAINQGAFLVMHRDHGYSNATGWAHPALASSQLPFLMNDSLLPLVFSVNCYSGNFRVAESFAERLIRQNSGASGVFAPSYYSYSGNNDAFLLGLYDALFSTPGLSTNFTGVGGNHTPLIPSHNSFNKPGDMLRYAVWYMNYNWGVDVYSSEIAHFQGDPAMAVMTNIPLQMMVNHKDTIDCIDSVMTVYVANSSGFVATLTVDDQVIARSYFYNDSAQLNFTPQYGVEAILTISGDLYAPYISPIYWFCSQPIYKPEAGFIVSDTLLCNNAISFTDTSLFEPTSWRWNFGDGVTSTQQNPIHQYATSGVYNVSLIAGNLIGTDTIMKNSLVHVIVPSTPLPIDTMLCNSSEILILNSTSDSIAWFSNDISQQVIAWGNFISLMPDTTLYQAAYVDMPTIEVGKNDTIGNGGYIYQNREHYLVFNALRDLVLATVDVYAMNASTKVIKVVNNLNQIIASKSVSVLPGKNTIQLGFYIPQGEGYRLVAPSYCSWYANFNCSDFPFLISDLITIDSSSANSNYYYFYRLQVQKRCYSQRIPISVHEVEIDTTLSISGEVMWCDQTPFNLVTDSMALVDWNIGSNLDSLLVNQSGLYFAVLEKNHCVYLTDTLHLIDYELVIPDFEILSSSSPSCFQNISSNAFAYMWDFGDGNYSSEVNPCHTYTSIGNYEVTLNAMNNCDTVSITKSAVVESINESIVDAPMLTLWPNPTKGIVELELKKSTYFPVIKVFDVQGRLIQSVQITQEHTSLDLNIVDAGVYLVEIVFIDSVQKIKLLKIKD